MMKRILMIAVVAAVSCAPVSAQVYRVAQMNTEQIRVVDKQKTVVVLERRYLVVLSSFGG
jgi:predicted S18 family serine protease